MSKTFYVQWKETNDKSTHQILAQINFLVQKLKSNFDLFENSLWECNQAIYQAIKGYSRKFIYSILLFLDWLWFIWKVFFVSISPDRLLNTTN